MRVAYLCHRIPYPPNKGEKIRAFHQLRGLAGRHEVDLFTLVDDPRDMDHVDALAPYCRQVAAEPIDARLARIRALPYLLTAKALTLPYFYASRLATRFREAVASRSYDRIFVYCSAMAQYAEGVPDIPIVTDFVDVDSDKWRQYAGFAGFPKNLVYRREARRLRAYEQKVCARSSSVVVTTEREADLVRSISAGANVHVVTNGVDAEYFRSDGSTPASTPPTILFVGDMSYFPNEEAVVTFSRQVLPLIRQEVPGTRFLVVGRGPGPAVRRLDGHNGVEVTGFVPDVRTYLAQAHVSVAPFAIAAGIQNKLLEAMAYGLPVVATSRAAQGLARKVAEVVHTADTHPEMASTIVRLLRDTDSARQKGAEGRLRVTEEYDWNSSNAKLLSILEDPYGANHLAHAAAAPLRPVL